MKNLSQETMNPIRFGYLNIFSVVSYTLRTEFLSDQIDLSDVKDARRNISTGSDKHYST